MHNLTTRLNPPEGSHEVDGCTDCHDHHTNPLLDYRTCERCAGWVADRADQVAFEFHFTVDDIKKAEEWAAAHHYRYDDVEHLLHDALIEKVIHTDRWKAA